MTAKGRRAHPTRAKRRVGTRYTVDASVFVNAFNPHEEGHAASLRILSAIQEREDPVIVPTLLIAEIAAAIAYATNDRTGARQYAMATAALPHLTLVSLTTAVARTSTKVAWDKKVPGLRRHALWLIEHHPEHEVHPPALSPQFDPEGFVAAKKLWEAHVARPDVSPFLVYRAVTFFAPHDKLTPSN